IRDLIVTGVQTCALPISKPKIAPPSMAGAVSDIASGRNALGIFVRATTNEDTDSLKVLESGRRAHRMPTKPRLPTHEGRHRRFRSEERRVGKERRARRSS